MVYLCKNEENHHQKEKQLKERFPDLDTTEGHYGQTEFLSQSVNSIATDCNFSHSCYCCWDAELYARPYTVCEGIMVYSNPDKICIGRVVLDGDAIFEDWEDRLKENGISSAAIERCRAMLGTSNTLKYNSDDEND